MQPSYGIKLEGGGDKWTGVRVCERDFFFFSNVWWELYSDTV